MFLMYIDESGDTGLTKSPTRYFVLTGMVIHELNWRPFIDSLIDFRRRMKSLYGLRLRDEIHASAFINAPGPQLSRIPKHDRLAILRHLADHIASDPTISLINVLVDKHGKSPGYDVFDWAWRALIQRFENTMVHRNFPGPANPDDRGMLFPDHTDDKKLRLLLRRLQRYNPIPNRAAHGPGYRNQPLLRVIEDQNFRDSAHSYFIQAVDTCAYLLYQHLTPNAYMRRNGGRNYFLRLAPNLCRVAAPGDAHGIVRL